MSADSSHIPAGFGSPCSAKLRAPHSCHGVARRHLPCKAWGRFRGSIRKEASPGCSTAPSARCNASAPNSDKLMQVLAGVRDGRLSPDAAAAALEQMASGITQARTQPSPLSPFSTLSLLPPSFPQLTLPSSAPPDRAAGVRLCGTRHVEGGEDRRPGGSVGARKDAAADMCHHGHAQVKRMNGNAAADMCHREPLPPCSSLSPLPSFPSRFFAAAERGS